MLGLDSFHRRLRAVMSGLAAELTAEIRLRSAGHTDSGDTGDEEGKLDALVKIKCIEASDSIMKLIRDLLSGAERAQTAEETGDFAAPLSEDDSSLLGPAVDLDHRYIRSSATPSATAVGEKERSAARKARKRTTTAVTATPTKSDEAEIPVTKSSRVQHICRYCGVLFSAMVDLRDHHRYVHCVVERPYACDYCDKAFSHKPHRDRHHRLHRGERTFQCETCGKGYTAASQLKIHKQTHAEKSFICDVCGNAFYQAGHLTRHKVVHEQVKPFHCDACGKGFTQAVGLRNHQLTHSGERQLCPVCGKSYRNLKHHMINKHAEDLPPEDAQRTQKKYSCDATGCAKKFLFPSLLNLHKRRAHGPAPRPGDRRAKPKSKEEEGGGNGRAADRPFVCGVCGASFNTASNLSRHGSIHTGETPFSCGECGKCFRLLDFLKAHEKIHLKHKETQQRGGEADEATEQPAADAKTQ